MSMENESAHHQRNLSELFQAVRQGPLTRSKDSIREVMQGPRGIQKPA